VTCAHSKSSPFTIPPESRALKFSYSSNTNFKLSRYKISEVAAQ
jgi:hypothetical protein